MTTTPPPIDVRRLQRQTLAEATAPLQLVALVPAVLAAVLPLSRYEPPTGSPRRELGVLRTLRALSSDNDAVPATVVVVLLLVGLAALALLALGAVLTVVPHPDEARRWRRRRAKVTWVACAVTTVALLLVSPTLSAVPGFEGSTPYEVHGHGWWTGVLAVVVTAAVQARIDAIDVRQ